MAATVPPQTKGEREVWASTEAGTPATSVELLERLRSGSTWTERMLSRDGNIHNLDAHIDELVFASRQLFERPVESRAVLASIRAALRHTQGTVDLRVELYGGTRSHVLAIATERNDAQAAFASIRLQTRPTGATSQLPMTRPQDAYDLITVSGRISHPAAGSVCLVSAHRLVWPDSHHPLEVTGRAIAEQFATTGITSVLLPVLQDHLDSFDGAYLIQPTGVVCIESIDDARYSVDADDLGMLRTAFERGPWKPPTLAGLD
jgi:hypothetical protein